MDLGTSCAPEEAFHNVVRAAWKPSPQAISEVWPGDPVASYGLNTL